MDGYTIKGSITVWLLAATGVVLSGCSNTAITPTPPPTVTKIYSGGLDSAATITQSSDGNQLEISNAAAIVTLVKTGTSGEFTTYADTLVTFNRAARARTASGAGVVTVAAGPGLGTQPGFLIEGTVPTSLPTSGTAHFLGQYLGYLFSSAGNIINPIGGTTDFISGTATLDADFATSSITGTISGRAHGTNIYNDITLSPTAIQADGTFSGVTSGGEGVNPGNVTIDNGYSGMLIGSAASEVAGGISLIHNNTIFPDMYFENGVFVAN